MTSPWGPYYQPDTLQLNPKRSRCQIHPENSNLCLDRPQPSGQLHREDHEEEQFLRPNISPRLKSNILQKLLVLMSQTHLLSKGSSTSNQNSYGAVPTHSHENLPMLNGESEDQDRKSATLDSYPSGSDTAYDSSGKARRRAPIIYGQVSQGAAEDGIINVAEDATDEDADPPDNSRYPQVRASVSAKDDSTASISTPRMWILSLLCVLLGSGSNLFFSLRYPGVFITPVIALVVVHPLGLAWDRLLKRDDDPTETFDSGTLIKTSLHEETALPTSISNRLRRWLGQGRWNEKEHACVIVEQGKFYKQDLSIMYQILLTVSTQILGYSFAGLTRRFLVRPPSMIWPATLMSTAMFTTMHKSENKIANGWTISRWRFFLLVFSAAFAWYFLPGLLFPALSYFSVVTWFAPQSVVLANLFGTSSGLGLFPVTFDWAQIAYIGSPLLTPWWAAANVVAGLVIVMWIVAPLMYYSNALHSAFLPILSSSVFDNTGKPYDVSRILTPEFLFDRDKFEAYSNVYLPITYALAYGVQFAGLAALVTHTACWYGKEIWQVSRQSMVSDKTRVGSLYDSIGHGSSIRPQGSSGKKAGSTVEAGIDTSMQGEDVHTRLMRRYDDAPASWYLVTFVAMLAIGIFVVEYYPVYLPWYGLLLALSITAVLFIPVAIVMALTNQHSSLYLICQIICGTVFPGRPVANMVFTTYCYISSAQGVKFSSDLKLGHYMKIPPKLLFQVQMFATLVSSFTQIGVLNWMFANIPSLCQPDAINGFSCPLARVHFNGSILWGVVGPHRFFGAGALYQPLIWFFLVGAVAPILVYVIARKRPMNSIWRKINLPVLFGSLSWIPPATGLNFSVWAVVCFIFNSVIRRRKPEWWGKYTMTLSAGLDSGLAIGVVVIFFGIIFPGWMEGFSWWGIEIYKQGCDWQACPYKTVKAGETFD
ncbi:MAG: hypothetical protein LQ337_003597 [Flavoplaca oasis]|nr:MAG: hypothetical protein LQ337_003597 [Flavoplaca oasis]